ncbi:MAG: hypothetical protein HY835_01420 [Anaerolineae bacterium]|nr:hypothetical protein [Anaerolineae bacterium]
MNQDTQTKASVFNTHVFALAVAMCAWLERAGIPARFCEGNCSDAKYQVLVPIQYAADAAQMLLA